MSEDPEYVTRARSRYSVADRDDAAARLREMLRPGDTVYTVLRHVSGSGMTRWISVLVMTADGPRDVSYLAAKVTDSPLHSRGHEGVERGGCGMDMGFDLVYSLARVLFQGRFRCVMSATRKCPSNDHVNARDWSRMRGQHSDAGYALVQRWL